MFVGSSLECHLRSEDFWWMILTNLEILWNDVECICVVFKAQNVGAISIYIQCIYISM